MNKLSRRQFLGVALSAPFILPSGLRAAAPNSKLNHACIGVTRQGDHDLRNLVDYDRAQIVALCDVDTEHLATAAKLVPGARLYTDWREMFEKEGDKIDSVNVTVPDHMHFPIAYTAVQRGKHLYCQKPMCHDLSEVRKLTAAAIKKGIVTQLGTQFVSSIAERMTVELIQRGAIGKIKHVYLCSTRPAPNRIKGPRPATGEEPPAHLKWDLWIGNAPMRPYAPSIYHPAAWRGWQDFGTSWVADMGCHILDATWRGLKLKTPTSVVAEVEESWKNETDRRNDNWPQAEHVTWTFPGNAMTEGKELLIEWFDGEMLPPKEVRDLYSGGKYPSEAAMLVGAEGAILHRHNTGPQLLPKEKFEKYDRPKPPPGNHYHQFVDACLGGEKTVSHFAQVAPMTETILLGTIAIRCPDKKLTWDAAKMKFPNHPDGERHLKRTYRAGWEVPA